MPSDSKKRKAAERSSKSSLSPARKKRAQATEEAADSDSDAYILDAPKPKDAVLSGPSNLPPGVSPFAKRRPMKKLYNPPKDKPGTPNTNASFPVRRTNTKNLPSKRVPSRSQRAGSRSQDLGPSGKSFNEAIEIIDSDEESIGQLLTTSAPGPSKHQPRPPSPARRKLPLRAEPIKTPTRPPRAQAHSSPIVIKSSSSVSPVISRFSPGVGKTKDDAICIDLSDEDERLPTPPEPPAQSTGWRLSVPPALEDGDEEAEPMVGDATKTAEAVRNGPVVASPPRQSASPPAPEFVAASASDSLPSRPPSHRPTSPVLADPMASTSKASTAPEDEFMQGILPDLFDSSADDLYATSPPPVRCATPQDPQPPAALVSSELAGPTDTRLTADAVHQEAEERGQHGGPSEVSRPTELPGSALSTRHPFRTASTSQPEQSLDSALPLPPASTPAALPSISESARPDVLASLPPPPKGSKEPLQRAGSPAVSSWETLPGASQSSSDVDDEDEEAEQMLDELKEESETPKRTLQPLPADQDVEMSDAKHSVATGDSARAPSPLPSSKATSQPGSLLLAGATVDTQTPSGSSQRLPEGTDASTSVLPAQPAPGLPTVPPTGLVGMSPPPQVIPASIQQSQMRPSFPSSTPSTRKTLEHLRLAKQGSSNPTSKKQNPPQSTTKLKIRERHSRPTDMSEVFGSVSSIPVTKPSSAVKSKPSRPALSPTVHPIGSTSSLPTSLESSLPPTAQRSQSDSVGLVTAPSTSSLATPTIDRVTDKVAAMDLSTPTTKSTSQSSLPVLDLSTQRGVKRKASTRELIVVEKRSSTSDMPASSTSAPALSAVESAPAASSTTAIGHSQAGLSASSGSTPIHPPRRSLKDLFAAKRASSLVLPSHSSRGSSAAISSPSSPRAPPSAIQTSKALDSASQDLHIAASPMKATASSGASPTSHSPVPSALITTSTGTSAASSALAEALLLLSKPQQAVSKSLAAIGPANEPLLSQRALPSSTPSSSGTRQDIVAPAGVPVFSSLTVPAADSLSLADSAKLSSQAESSALIETTRSAAQVSPSSVTPLMGEDSRAALAETERASPMDEDTASRPAIETSADPEVPEEDMDVLPEFVYPDSPSPSPTPLLLSAMDIDTQADADSGDPDSTRPDRPRRSSRRSQANHSNTSSHPSRSQSEASSSTSRYSALPSPPPSSKLDGHSGKSIKGPFNDQYIDGHWIIENSPARFLHDNPPVVYYAKDLPHILQDRMNSLPEDYRFDDTARLVFIAAMQHNTGGDEPSAPDIDVVNDIDDDKVPPWEFHYTNKMWLGEGVPNPDLENLQGCSCVGRCNPESGSCACIKRQAQHWQSGGFVYDSNGRLKKDYQMNIPIFECSDLCGCWEDCPNRVVQRGRQYPLSIKKTQKKGWGVFAASKKIPKNTYIGIYSGELLTDDVGDMRGKMYDKFGRTYLFDLEFWYLEQEDPDYRPFVVDAYHAGNFTRFLNHSCDPNCMLTPCYVNEANLKKPLLTVWTMKDIDKDEELTFSYYGLLDDEEVEEQVADVKQGAVYAKCHCGAKNCRGILFR